MDLQLDSSSVIITAASQGLGKAVARKFVSEGATVIISSRNEDNLTSAKEDILETTEAESSSIYSVTCDLTDENQIRDLISEGADRLEGLDILVTNHGGPPAQTFAESTVDDFDVVYQNVLRSTITLVEEALPYIREDGGAITNMVSASAQEPPVGHVLSNTIRPGIYGLSKSLSREYANQGVRINCVCPRGVMTDRIEYKIEVLAERENISINDAKKQRQDELPIKRLGDPEEFAQAVAFVSSEAASFTTGATIHIDGGWTKKLF